MIIPLTPTFIETITKGSSEEKVNLLPRKLQRIQRVQELLDRVGYQVQYDDHYVYIVPLIK